MRRASLLLATVILCVAAPATAASDSNAAFDSQAYAPYARHGPYEIAATLAVSLTGGDTRSKAGVLVSAYPDLPFTRSWLHASAQDIADRAHGPNEFDDPEPPPELVRFRHTARTDANGDFTIRGLTAGSWALRGRLSVAFPHEVSVLRSTQDGTDNGVPVIAQQVVNETVVDYSYLWLDATAVGVGLHFTPEVYFHVAARRNKLARPQ